MPYPSPKHKYQLDCILDPAGVIGFSVRDAMEEIWREVMDTREQQTRQALVKLGWTPPFGDIVPSVPEPIIDFKTKDRPMSTERPKAKHELADGIIAILQAYKEGKPLQVRDMFGCFGTWSDYADTNPTPSNFATMEWRIKPAEPLRAWANVWDSGDVFTYRTEEMAKNPPPNWGTSTSKMVRCAVPMVEVVPE